MLPDKAFANRRRIDLNGKQYITVGKILSSWGVRGQVKVEPLTDNPKRFKTLNEVFIDFKSQVVSYKVESVMFLREYFPVLKFECINSKEEADTLKGHYINIDRKDAVKLSEDRFFICDIIGLHVFNEFDTYIGTVIEVIQTGANDVYVVETKDKNEILIPAIKQVVKKVDLKNGIMIIRPLEGML